MALKHLNLPIYLNTDEKWKKCVDRVNTLEKYELFVKILMECDLSLSDFFTTVKTFEHDIMQYHGNPDFGCISHKIKQKITELKIELEQLLS